MLTKQELSAIIPLVRVRRRGVVGDLCNLQKAIKDHDLLVIRKTKKSSFAKIIATSLSHVESAVSYRPSSSKPYAYGYIVERVAYEAAVASAAALKLFARYGYIWQKIYKNQYAIYHCRNGEWQQGETYTLQDNQFLSSAWNRYGLTVQKYVMAGSAGFLITHKSRGNFHYPGTENDAIKTAIRVFRIRREYIAELGPSLETVYVTEQDSLDAGNCAEETKPFAKKVKQYIGAEGPVAVRADVILALRNDMYTRNAIKQAQNRKSA